MMGADDFLSKPFHPAELRARVDTIRRRYRQPAGSTNYTPSPVVASGALHFEFEPSAVFVRGIDAHFTPMEVKILSQLVRYQGQTLRHEFISEQIWGFKDDNARSMVKAHIGSIRRKIRSAGGSGEEIRTVHGVGYCFSPMNV